MDIGEIGWEILDWINLAQESDIWLSILNTVMKVRVP
jgi:hypothetical protein